VRVGYDCCGTVLTSLMVDNEEESVTQISIV
jgi:hypothetical protein